MSDTRKGLGEFNWLTSKARKPSSCYFYKPQDPRHAPADPSKKVLRDTPKPNLLLQQEGLQKNIPAFFFKIMGYLNLFECLKVSQVNRELRLRTLATFAQGSAILPQPMTPSSVNRWIKVFHTHQTLIYHTEKLNFHLKDCPAVHIPTRCDPTGKKQDVINQFKKLTHACGLCSSSVAYKQHFLDEIENVLISEHMACSDCIDKNTWNRLDAMTLWGFSLKGLEKVPSWPVTVKQGDTRTVLHFYATPDLFDAWYQERMAQKSEMKFVSSDIVDFNRVKDLPVAVQLSRIPSSLTPEAEKAFANLLIDFFENLNKDHSVELAINYLFQHILIKHEFLKKFFAESVNKFTDLADLCPTPTVQVAFEKFCKEQKIPQLDPNTRCKKLFADGHFESAIQLFKNFPDHVSLEHDYLWDMINIYKNNKRTNWDKYFFFLLEQGLDPNCKSMEKNTSILIESISLMMDPNVIQKLVEKKADVNFQSRLADEKHPQGLTPLANSLLRFCEEHDKPWAAKHCLNLEIADFLMTSGAKTNTVFVYTLPNPNDRLYYEPATYLQKYPEFVKTIKDGLRCPRVDTPFTFLVKLLINIFTYRFGNYTPQSICYIAESSRMKTDYPILFTLFEKMCNRRKIESKSFIELIKKKEYSTLLNKLWDLLTTLEGTRFPFRCDENFEHALLAAYETQSQMSYETRVKLNLHRLPRMVIADNQFYLDLQWFKLIFQKSKTKSVAAVFAQDLCDYIFSFLSFNDHKENVFAQFNALNYHERSDLLAKFPKDVDTNPNFIITAIDKTLTSFGVSKDKFHIGIQPNDLLSIKTATAPRYLLFSLPFKSPELKESTAYRSAIVIDNKLKLFSMVYPKCDGTTIKNLVDKNLTVLKHNSEFKDYSSCDLSEKVKTNSSFLANVGLFSIMQQVGMVLKREQVAGAEPFMVDQATGQGYDKEDLDTFTKICEGGLALAVSSQQ